METPTTSQLVESGTSSCGFAYVIKIHLKGSKAQYYSLKGTKAEKHAFLHSSHDLSYLKRVLKANY
jgi:hypothetical protein